MGLDKGLQRFRVLLAVHPAAIPAGMLGMGTNKGFQRFVEIGAALAGTG